MSVPFGIYIHLPFCKAKCNYCDFYSLGGACNIPQEYISAIIREYKVFCRDNDVKAVDTVYFGGGTPSLLYFEQIDSILAEIPLAKNAEITIEANPDSVDYAKLCSYYKAGINRISFGVQSAYDTSLRGLGRLHNSDSARQALENAKKVGFSNISGDIMLALPDYSFKELDDTVALLAEYCTHISAYMLIIEENTPFYNSLPSNLPTEEQSADYYLYCVEKLAQRGYAQYEISNFARKGYESRHNLIYWQCGDYLGLGPSAHSCINGQRFYYPPNLQSFLQEAKTVKDGVVTSDDYIILSLRLNAGLKFDKLKKDFNIDLEQTKKPFLAKLIANGLAVQNGDIFYLTPRGMLIQNSILCELM